MGVVFGTLWTKDPSKSDDVNYCFIAALMYVLVPMPCLFFGGGSTQFLTSRDGGGWVFLYLSLYMKI